ncbi:MAG: BMP family ABC transporter substrate-binding protein [Candidatus Adiutrix sp.]
MKKFAVLLCALALMLAFGGKAMASQPSAVLVVTGLLGDKSFNDSANRGLEGLKSAGWTTKVIEIGRDQTKWEPTFMDLSESGEWDLIITNGSNAIETIQDVSKEFPNQKYLLYDSEIEKGAYPNIYAVSYKQNEGSYVAGVLAALVTTSNMKGTNPEPIIGFIGGMKHPIITDFLVGYIEGAKAVEPNIKVVVSYIGSWDDTAKGKEVAMAQFQRGVDITFPAAEQAGLGCVEAAKEMGRYIIGVDSDQAMLFKGIDEASANVILTSVLKNVDKSIVRAGELFVANKLPFGDFESLGIAEDGAGIAYNEYYEKNVPAEIAQKVEAARQEVVDGKVEITSALSVAPDVSDAIINSVRP